MPAYDYHCPACKEDYIRLVRWVDADDQVCACGRPLKRLASSPSFRVEGFNAKNGYSNRKDD
jgi:putative FmdB family regulatory protein